MLDKHLGHPFHPEFGASILPEIWRIHFDHIVRVAMFLCHARSPQLVVQEKLKIFNVGQVFRVSILLGIWSIHLAGNQIVRVAMFLYHTRSPLQIVQEKSLLAVQEKFKTFNVGQAFGHSIHPEFGASIWLGTRL